LFLELVKISTDAVMPGRKGYLLPAFTKS
jgi:hypothetical protein